MNKLTLDKMIRLIVINWKWIVIYGDAIIQTQLKLNNNLVVFTNQVIRFDLYNFNFLILSDFCFQFKHNLLFFISIVTFLFKNSYE